MPRHLPRVNGIVRDKKSSALHNEVVRNLQDIANREDKTFSWVVAEIVYKFFGLQIEDNIVKIRRTMKKSKAKRRKVPYRKNVIHFPRLKAS